ncbi:MAG: hypothetical protein HC896_12800 [Bacteroidales bacterium]|nr:hypothetical protein [Bacteroidales bacterium]
MLAGYTLAQTGSGLLGVYYFNADFTGKTMERTENVNLSGETVPGFALDFFSVRWTGHIKPVYSETYTFYLTSDDGSRLYINDSLVINGFFWPARNHARWQN